MTSRQLVLDTIEFKNYSERLPRDVWVLPWATMFEPEKTKHIKDSFEWDIITSPAFLTSPTIDTGDLFEVGDATDSWGCKFHNIFKGIHGEVKEPLVKDDDWEDADAVHIPIETLSVDIESVNKFCLSSDSFVLSGCCPRPFEQLQFIRGTENLFMDLIDPPKKMLEFMEQMHDLYCKQMRLWATTEVDSLNMMDDWGAQNSMLISPDLWVKYFKPMYKDYIDIAHSAGKKIFMHSDGYTLPIIPHLIELGLDVFNAQIFCIGLDKLKQFKGKLTFWGEIDRQHIIPYGSKEDIHNAVDEVYETFWQDGGVIAQCEYGSAPGNSAENVYEIFRYWNEMRSDRINNAKQAT